MRASAPSLPRWPSSAGILLVAYLVSNTLANLETRNIATGFGFLQREAGFGISESAIPYNPANTYFRALAVGVFNTLKVAVVGIILATFIGILAGVARLSRNWLVARLATCYVEGLRNIPVLLQLFFWYALITEGLPGPRQALNPLPGIFLSARGLKLPEPVWQTTHAVMLVVFLVAIAVAWAIGRWAKLRQDRSGQVFPTLPVSLGLIIGLPFLVWLLGGAPMALDVPALQGFNFVGGVTITPEFTALLVGLVLYTATFIAEIVRGGILAVAHGQTEAGLALGLSRGQVLRLVTLPQAMRVIIPPLTSQYLNLTKNSSLAVAIGFPDLVSVANTAINQTGQAVEGVAIIMAVYLTVSLSISTFMNWYNRRIAVKGGR
ncbi:amino acid ABC transporter permease [Defluviicoccus vanus]|uniref:Amino acid ABC transporter permease n=1 Tax=Defluviicoccus vanus TaxID=111831 RepID=A0A7H1N2U1_9PROT|nr:amino acid ABC transporter permease [Defluviicoccus vanus]QNT70027.1 amino acid ABC transporter permease [Defluviicoccus vanus]